MSILAMPSFLWTPLKGRPLLFTLRLRTLTGRDNMNPRDLEIFRRQELLAALSVLAKSSLGVEAINVAD